VRNTLEKHTSCTVILSSRCQLARLIPRRDLAKFRSTYRSSMISKMWLEKVPTAWFGMLILTESSPPLPSDFERMANFVFCCPAPRSISLAVRR